MIAIKGGLVIDGSGAGAYEATVVVEGDRITDVTREEVAGAETFDAAGCIVSPGFIDCHAHSDAYLVLEPSAPSKISQGITTEINGQCGGSIAPRYGEARLSSDWASLLGERLTWHSLAEYREALEAAGPGVNTVQFTGHNTLRSSVVGYAGRPATEDEMREMERMLAQTMDEGARGLTTGLIYQPGKYSTPREVERLAKVAAERGGLYATHMRSEGDEILEAIDETAQLARATGIRAEISHLKTAGRRNWGKIDAVLEKIEAGMAEGVFLGSDRYPYCAAGTDLDVVLPDWAQEGAAKAECERLSDAALRERITREIDESGRDWTTVAIGGTWHPCNKKYSGRTVAEILESGDGGAAGARGAGALVCEILEKDSCRTGAFFSGMCEENLGKILSKKWILPGSDASLRSPEGPLGEDWPHPRAYGTMPEFYRRLRALGTTREEAVRRMTGEAAKRFGLPGRGLIAKGAFADIAVWREDGFKALATYADPHRFAAGVELVMVNGVAEYERGRFTGRRGGRFLDRFLI